ncbi:class F sortase [Streptomyces sp. NPDC048297]|uniref:class F sortase n=1 Tax=Streptomyces sp. NPDC048297 TaxID=3365531 RepID=UPI0037149473
MSDDQGSLTGTGRLTRVLAWAVLLLGLWLWGRDLTGLPDGPTRGDVAGLGTFQLPDPAKPLDTALPRRVDIPELGIQAPVVARGLDSRGAIDPPPFDQPGVVGWYRGGVTPGATGPALLVGHVDTETGRAVFYQLSTLKPGETVRVVRSDGKVAEFTIDDVRVLPVDHFDAQLAYGPRVPGRAELRLITCGGTFDRTSHTYTANVIVSAYLTGTTP